MDKNNPWFEELIVKTKEAYYKDEKGGAILFKLAMHIHLATFIKLHSSSMHLQMAID